MFASIALMHIYVTLEPIVRKYKDQRHDVMNQLHENVSPREPVLFIGRALRQPDASPVCSYSLGNVK